MIESKTLGTRLFKVFNYVFLALLAFTCFFPLWYTFCLSVSDKAATNAGWVTVWPVGFTTASYKEIIKDGAFFNSFWISIQRVAIATPITLIVTILMAYPLSKSKHVFGGKNFVMWTLIFCMLFNGGTVPWYICMKNYGLMDSLWGLILSGSLPMYNVILVMNFFKNLPKELEEAAIVDGAGQWRILFSIIVPCSVPVIATITLFVSVYHWNEYFQGLVLSNTEDHYPLQTYIKQIVVTLPAGTSLSTEQLIKFSQLSNKSLNAAKVFITMLPMLVVYPWIQRYFVTGIMIGAVKE